MFVQPSHDFIKHDGTEASVKPTLDAKEYDSFVQENGLKPADFARTSVAVDQTLAPRPRT